MKWPRAFSSSLINSAAILLPFLAVGESHLEMGAGRGLSAAAHVNFRIVIPKVLSLDTEARNDRAAGARTVGIFTNSHNVALAATLRPLDGQLPTAGDEAHASLILNAAARKGIAQDAVCALGDARPGAESTDARGVAAKPRSIVCTASMP